MIKVKSRGIRFLILIGVFFVVLLLLQFLLPSVGTMWLALVAAAAGFFVADSKLLKTQPSNSSYVGD